MTKRPAGQGMTKAEREDLSRLIRRRETLMKHRADERRAVLLAEFERQSAAIYSYDNDAAWKAAWAEAQKAVQAAQEQIASRCRELGIPREFAPGLSVSWYGRGENAVASRRVELRRVATAHIDARIASAKVAIEQQSVELQTEIVAESLTSATAKIFLERMPTVEAMIPSLSTQEVRSLLPRAVGEAEGDEEVSAPGASE